jgi:glucose-6-phosphate isomerase
MTNAHATREWSLASVGGDEKSIARHFVAVSTNGNEVSQFGIDTAEMFEFLGLGRRTLFDGLGDWPFDNGCSRSRKFSPAYLQQLTMESNGKNGPLDGSDVTYPTGPIYWEEPGTNGQHSFYQLIHPGTRLIRCDFIAFGQALNPLSRHHDILRANVCAQTEALALGKTPEQVKADGTPYWLVPHRAFEGNRPSNTFLAAWLTPETLEKLAALYEHSVFTQGTIWSIDSFDQWGVELDKVLAHRIIAELESETEPKLTNDSSTNAVVRQYRKLKGDISGIEPSGSKRAITCNWEWLVSDEWAPTWCGGFSKAAMSASCSTGRRKRSTSWRGTKRWAPPPGRISSES